MWLGLFLASFSFAEEKGVGDKTSKPATAPSANKTEGVNDDIKDTIPAFVMYGSRFLLDSLENFDPFDVMEYRDSLLCLVNRPVTLLKQIDIYLRVQRMRKKQIISLIDSLFEEDYIPYPLINQINYYVATHPIDEIIESEVAIADTSKYPANSYYGSWNPKIPNPYPLSLPDGDTTLYLTLLKKGVDEEFCMPVNNTLTSTFGWRDGKPHKGIDIDLEVWDPIKSCFSGMVRVAQYYGGYGRVVVIRHDNGLETLYAHLHRIKVKPGQRVTAGEVIGLGGSSGHSTGSHLHFEVRFKGVPLNPLSFISHKESKLTCDTLVLKKTKYGYASYPQGTKFHVVEKGDALSEIAKKYGMTTVKLAEINGIKKSTILRVGQTLRVSS